MHKFSSTELLHLATGYKYVFKNFTFEKAKKIIESAFDENCDFEKAKDTIKSLQTLSSDPNIAIQKIKNENEKLNIHPETVDKTEATIRQCGLQFQNYSLQQAKDLINTLTINHKTEEVLTTITNITTIIPTKTEKAINAIETKLKENNTAKEQQRTIQERIEEGKNQKAKNIIFNFPLPFTNLTQEDAIKLTKILILQHKKNIQKILHQITKPLSENITTAVTQVKQTIENKIKQEREERRLEQERINTLEREERRKALEREEEERTQKAKIIILKSQKHFTNYTEEKAIKLAKKLMINFSVGSKYDIHKILEKTDYPLPEDIEIAVNKVKEIVQNKEKEQARLQKEEDIRAKLREEEEIALAVLNSKDLLKRAMQHTESARWENHGTWRRKNWTLIRMGDNVTRSGDTPAVFKANETVYQYVVSILERRAKNFGKGNRTDITKVTKNDKKLVQLAKSILERKHVKPSRLMKISDIHARSWAVEQCGGWPRMLRVITTVEKTKEGTLLDGSSAGIERDILVVTCPSTKQKYVMFVPIKGGKTRNVKTALKAVNGINSNQIVLQS